MAQGLLLRTFVVMPKELDLETLVASQLAGNADVPPPAAVAATWRFAGIVDLAEVRSWLDVGVFDGHRAGLLRMAGVHPRQLGALPDPRRVGMAFAMGELSVSEVWNLILALEDGPHGDSQPFDVQTTLVRERSTIAPRDDDA